MIGGKNGRIHGACYMSIATASVSKEIELVCKTFKPGELTQVRGVSPEYGSGHTPGANLLVAKIAMASSDNSDPGISNNAAKFTRLMARYLGANRCLVLRRIRDVDPTSSRGNISRPRFP